MAPATTNHRTILGGAVVAALLVLGGCGDDSDEAFDDIEDLEDLAPETAPDDDGTEPDADANGGGERELEPLTFALPQETEPASGFAVVSATCEPPDEYGSAYSFAVPEPWEATGRGGGGSGSPLSSSTEIRFTAEDGEVAVDVEPDSRRPDGPVLDSSGEPFESFDYDYSRGDDSGTITFGPVGTASVGDQEAEVLVADQSQAPDALSATEYKTRLEVAELPNPAPGDEDGVAPVSMVVTITHDADEVALDEETVVDIVESFAIPECTREQVIVGQEVLLGQDVDGDGEVSGPEDL